MKDFDFILWNWFSERTKILKDHPNKIMFDCTATTIYDNWHWRIKQGKIMLHLVRRCDRVVKALMGHRWG